MAVLETIAGAAATGAVDAATSAIGNQRKYRYWVKQQDELEKRQIAAEKRQFDYNKDLQDYAFRQNLEQWQRENRYNSPSAQMQRYKAAGLNANLIYGQSNLAASSPEMSIGDVGSGQAQTASPLDIEGFNIDPAIMQRLINETKLANANVENINADTEKKETETENIEEDTRGKKIDNEFKTEINPTKIEQAAADLEKTKQETNLVMSEVKKTDLESDLLEFQKQIAELDRQIKKVQADHAEELAQLQIKREQVQISFVNHQIAYVAKQIASYDDELKARLALSAAETLNRTAFAHLAESRTSYQDYVNKMNSILLDPTVDTDASTYWSALMLKNLSETSAMDVIKEARQWFGLGSDSKDKPSKKKIESQRENEIDEPSEDGDDDKDYHDIYERVGAPILKEMTRRLNRR